MRWTTLKLSAIMLLAMPTVAVGAAANCRNTGSFEQWLAQFKREAAAEGVSKATIAAALDSVTYDPTIIARDRGQRFFGQTFLEFSGKMLMAYRLQRGPQLIKKHAETFTRIQREFGVPAAVIVGFWGLESDFGAGMGKLPTLRSIATLAYDCRRPEMFRPELMAALKVIDRGDLKPHEMIGSWAGELGQTQFLPTLYFKYAVDYDGDGRRDLLHSVPDVLASTAKYLADLGWRRGEPWLREVRVPADLPWEQADLAIKHPHAQWSEWGVTLPDGKPLPAGGPSASLLLPMGRLGPAFLAYPNFSIYSSWNNSLVYATTAAYYATRLGGAPALGRGRGTPPPFDANQVRELQQILARRGYDIGKVDGVLGAKTRSAVKDMQVKLKLPADSYPTPELLERLRARG